MLLNFELGLVFVVIYQNLYVISIFMRFYDCINYYNLKMLISHFNIKIQRT